MEKTTFAIVVEVDPDGGYGYLAHFKGQGGGTYGAGNTPEEAAACLLACEAENKGLPTTPWQEFFIGEDPRPMTNSYMLWQQLTNDGEIWTEKFIFEAGSPEEAWSKAQGWARYHGLSIPEVRIERLSKSKVVAYGDSWVHNEWVN